MGRSMNFPREDASRPNVIVALTSQWRGSALGIAGDPTAKTPNLDALANEGLGLSQAVTPHPFGVFARAAFLTGRPCPENGIRDYYDILPLGSRTLAHAFTDFGYQTAFFGKWQLYKRDPDAPVVGETHGRIVIPEAYRGGFEYWEGFESGFLINDPLLHGTSLPEPTRFEGYQSDVLVDRFLRFEENRGANNRPLFVVVSLDPPHPPYGANAGVSQPLLEDEVRLIDGTTRDPELRAVARRELAGYYAHIEATDRSIGRLVDTLKDRGAWNDTLFAVSSVHGDMHGFDGKFRKGWPHEESVRIPMILSWPNHLPQCRNGKLLASLLDLGPSLLGLATGADSVAMASYGFHGLNLASATLGENPGPARQTISMPSAPAFEKQCPYPWVAYRDAMKTTVYPEEGDCYVICHENPVTWEG